MMSHYLLNSVFKPTSKRASKLCITGNFWHKYIVNWWIPYIKGQYCGKMYFNDLTTVVSGHSFGVAGKESFTWTNNEPILRRLINKRTNWGIRKLLIARSNNTPETRALYYYCDMALSQHFLPMEMHMPWRNHGWFRPWFGAAGTEGIT